VKRHGTPVVVSTTTSSAQLRHFPAVCPKVQAYYAVKASNPAPEIIRTLYRAGASFDGPLPLPEFMMVHENIQHLPAKERQDFIWGKIIYANPSSQGKRSGARPVQTAAHFDNLDELRKIKTVRAPCGPGIAVRAPTPLHGGGCRASSAATPARPWTWIVEAFRIGLVVEGLSFHVGSQWHNFDNFVQL